MKKVLLLVASLVVLASAPQDAAAQPLDDASRAAARRLGYDGVHAYEGGDYAAANDQLGRAYAVLRVPTIGLWSARSLAKVGRLVAASERYQEVLRLPLPDVEADVHKKAQADALAERDALLPRLAHVLIVVTPSPLPASVTVTLDGQNVPLAILGSDLPVDPGLRHVELRSGTRVSTRDVTLAEGESQRVELVVESEPVAPPPAVPTAAPPVVDPGVSTAGPPPLRTAGFITAGVGAAGVAFGAIMGGVAASKNSDLDETCRADVCPAESTDAVSSYHTFRALSIAGLWIGGAALATGIVLVLVSPRQSATPSLSMAIGPTGFGFSGRY